MKILVLGSKGQLGTELLEVLASGHAVQGVDIDDFDLTSFSDCRETVAASDPDAVVNAAAYTDVDGCETAGDLCFAVNAEGVGHMARVCGERGIKLVHFSTDYVFDGTKGKPYVEGDLCNPINAYGRSKLQGEIYLKEYAGDYLLIRTAWLYGRTGRNFVRAIVDKARHEKQLQVVNDQIGSPTCSLDLALAVKLLLEGGHSGVFHVTNRGRCSWYEFAVKIVQYAQIPDVQIEAIDSSMLRRKALRPAYSVLSCRKFAHETGKTTRYWQVALKDFLEKTWRRADVAKPDGGGSAR
jgi:dTDP-4-dehydrorhamnose reductase